MTFNIDVGNIFRTIVIMAVGLPFSLSLTGALNANTALTKQRTITSQKAEVYKELQGQMVLPCIKYRVSKNDSKLEREAKNELDEIFGGEIVHGSACNFVLNTEV